LYFCPRVCLDKGLHVLLELRQPGCTGERFVVAVEREDHIGPGVGQLEAVVAVSALVALAKLVGLRARSVAGEPFILRAERHRPQAMIGVGPAVDFIAAVTQVADHEVVTWILRVQQRFEPAVMLHPLGQSVADDGDVVVGPELEFRRLLFGSQSGRNRTRAENPSRQQEGRNH
jgi:hypothetical protein